MATFTARQLMEIASNVSTIVEIEMLAAIQAVEFHRPLTTTSTLEHAEQVRTVVPRYVVDRYMAPDLAAIQALFGDGRFDEVVQFDMAAHG
jgi:histidine ammonia-lyase